MLLAQGYEFAGVYGPFGSGEVQGWQHTNRLLLRNVSGS